MLSTEPNRLDLDHWLVNDRNSNKKNCHEEGVNIRIRRFKHILVNRTETDQEDKRKVENVNKGICDDIIASKVIFVPSNTQRSKKDSREQNKIELWLELYLFKMAIAT